MTEYPDWVYTEKEPSTLGRLVRASNQNRSEVSRGQHEAARNLLRRAMRAQEAGDAARAGHWVQRAQAIGYDEHEEVDVTSWEAHMLLFTVVADALEACEEDDEAWLDPLPRLAESAGPAAARELSAVLSILDTDHDLSDRERRRLRTMMAPVDERPPLVDGRPADANELLDVLALVHTYEMAVPELLTDPTW